MIELGEAKKTPIYFFEGDDQAKLLAETFSRRYEREVQGSSKIDYSQPFFLINGWEENHDRTLPVIQKMPKVEAYVHIDQHDDIGLWGSNSSDSDHYGPANFVEGILRLGKKVVYVGQRYWSFRLLFNKKIYVGLYRINLDRYSPLDSIFMIQDADPFAFFCHRDSVKKILSVLPTLAASADTEAILVSEEFKASIPKGLDNKVQTFKPEEVTLFLDNGTPIDSHDNIQPVFVLLKRMYKFENLPSVSAYVSIDMDITEQLPVRVVYWAVTQILVSDLTIAGIDIYGLNPGDDDSVVILKKLVDLTENTSWIPLQKLTGKYRKTTQPT